MSFSVRAAARLLFVGLAAVMLAACETPTGGPATQTSKPAEPPMTRTRAATECWMATEKGRASGDIDKRADLVNKCIDEKMKAAQARPAG